MLFDMQNFQKTNKKYPASFLGQKISIITTVHIQIKIL